MKVLMLVPNLQVANGVASFVMNYLRSLERSVVRVDIASYQGGNSIYYEQVEKLGGKIYFLPNIRNLSEHINPFRRMLRYCPR